MLPRCGRLANYNENPFGEAHDDNEFLSVRDCTRTPGRLMIYRTLARRGVGRAGLAMLTALLVALQLPVSVQAQYTYVTNSSAITITGYTGAGGALVISNSLSGLTVVGINDAVFQNLSSLTSVTIPSSITHIGQNAFAGCINLTAFTLDPGNPAYSSLDGVLFNKDQTTLLQCPGAKTGSYRIPSTVTNVGNAAFQYCANLTGVIIPPSVTTIGSVAFEYFRKLVVVTISANVTNIGAFAFDGCDLLTTITVDPGNPVYSSRNGVLFNKDQTTLLQCPGGRTGHFIIPNGVRSIGEGAFGWDRYLNSVTFPEGVTNIGSRAFMDCYLLTDVSLPNSLTTIGDEAFIECLHLTNVTIPAGVTNIGSGAFENCAGLTGVHFVGSTPPGFGGNVFLADTNATAYYLPGVTSFGATYAGLSTATWTGAPYAILTVLAAPANGGTASGSGTYLISSNVQILATPNPGWMFTRWNDSNNHSTRTINVPTGGATYTANFGIELPAIGTAPGITNGLLQVNHIPVVLPGAINYFAVQPRDPADPNLWYRWNFGDGSTSSWSTASTVAHSYSSSNCGVHASSVIISNALSAQTVSSNFVVTAACALMLTKLQLSLSFIRTNTDGCQLNGKLALPGTTNVNQLTGTIVLVDVGDAQVAFTLDAKGRSVSGGGTCRLTYTKPTRTKSSYWTATIALSKGTWRNLWGRYGMDDATHKSPGISVRMPVGMLVGAEAFAADPNLHYVATLHKTGLAK